MAVTLGDRERLVPVIVMAIAAAIWCGWEALVAQQAGLRDAGTVGVIRP